jgi:hypothetical protein
MTVVAGSLLVFIWSIALYGTSAPISFLPLAIAFSLLIPGVACLLGGQQLRFNRDDKRRGKS